MKKKIKESFLEKNPNPFDDMGRVEIFVQIKQVNECSSKITLKKCTGKYDTVFILTTTVNLILFQLI